MNIQFVNCVHSIIEHKKINLQKNKNPKKIKKIQIMRLFFKTTNPSKLKSDIIKLIEDNELKTWEIHESDSTKYIKHTQQWGDKGVIKITADTTNNQIIVEVLKFKNITEDVKDFEGYYLGRFCEIIFVNFPNNFSSIIKEN